MCVSGAGDARVVLHLCYIGAPTPQAGRGLRRVVCGPGVEVRRYVSPSWASSAASPRLIALPGRPSLARFSGRRRPSRFRGARSDFSSSRVIPSGAVVELGGRRKWCCSRWAALDVLQSVFPEVSDQEPLDELAGRLREQDLTTVARGCDTSRKMHVVSDVALVGNERGACVQADAQADRARRESLRDR